jgi:ribosomal protein L37E
MRALALLPFLATLASGSYGLARAPPRPERVSVARCDPHRSFHVGDSAYEVLSRCGYPASRDFRQVERQVSAAGLDGIVHGDAAVTDIETWTYNFGSRTLQRRLEFIDGRLVEIATGTYGYD